MDYLPDISKSPFAKQGIFDPALNAEDKNAESSSSNLFAELKDPDIDNGTNLFLQQEPQIDPKSNAFSINGFDSELFENSFVRSKASEHLRLEMKLDEAETELSSVKSQISIIQSLGIVDKEGKLEKLRSKETALLNEIKELKLEYKNLGFSNTFSELSAEIINILVHSIKDPTLQTGNKLKHSVPILKEKEDFKNMVGNYSTIYQQMSELLKSKPMSQSEIESRLQEFETFLAKAHCIDAKLNRQNMQKTGINNENNLLARLRKNIADIVIRTQKLTE